MNRTSSISEALSRLAGLETNGHRVLSLYLNLDPSELPNLRERRMQLDALLADAERRGVGDGNGSRAYSVALREDIERVRGFLTDAELAAPSARGLAIFCSVPADIFEVVTLPRPVEGMVAVEARPFIAPLVELTAPERWCVLLVSRRATRILRGTRARLVEVSSALDDVHGRHAQGGWSQSRFQRAIENEVDEHVRSACSALFERFKRRGFDRLLIASPAELHHRVEHELHADLRQRLAGHFEIDVERATPAEVQERAAPLIDADERRREHEALERLAEGMAPGGHAATGLEEVLQLLDERRVQTLLLAHGFTAPGFACPRCGRLGVSDAPCPTDGAAPEPHGDIVESAIGLALRQSADVLIVRHQPSELAEHSPVAALLRY
jgi:peptide chain release factor subunit 1